MRALVLAIPIGCSAFSCGGEPEDTDDPHDSAPVLEGDDCVWPLGELCEGASCPDLASQLPGVRDATCGGGSYALTRCGADGAGWVLGWTYDTTLAEVYTMYFDAGGALVASALTTDVRRDCAGEPEAAFSYVYGHVPECADACTWEQCNDAMVTAGSACVGGAAPP